MIALDAGSFNPELKLDERTCCDDELAVRVVAAEGNPPKEVEKRFWLLLALLLPPWAAERKLTSFFF